MKHDPLISVITIVFNNCSGIEETIISVLSQSYSNIQYIVVDGGSVDGTVDIINQYSKSIDVFVSENDVGISDAFNKGIFHARGDVVGIINSGDTLNTGALSSIAEAFAENPTIGYVYGNSILNDLKGKMIRELKPQHTGFPYFGMPYQHSAIYFNKSVYDRVGGYNVNYRNSMDFELLMRVFKFEYKGVYVDCNISNYSRGGVSDLDFIRGYLEVLSASLVFDGASKVLVVFSFLFGVIKTSLRKGFEKLLYK